MSYTTIIDKNLNYAYNLNTHYGFCYALIISEVTDKWNGSMLRTTDRTCADLIKTSFCCSTISRSYCLRITSASLFVQWRTHFSMSLYTPPWKYRQYIYLHIHIYMVILFYSFSPWYSWLTFFLKLDGI